MALNAPSTLSLLPTPFSNCTVTPGSTVNVVVGPMVTPLRHTSYGLLINDQVVLLLIGPQTLVIFAVLANLPRGVMGEDSQNYSTADSARQAQAFSLGQ
jgi:hypothetical protein